MCWQQKEINMKKEAIIADNAPKEIGAYSNAVRTGNLVFVSGQLPVNPVTGEVPMAIQDQTRQVIENIRNILKDAGATLADVAKVNVVLTEMSLFSEMNAVYAKEFSEPYPARTSMAVKELPHNALVSMDVVAVIG
jgi:2-iminobutanoate/2-iminopropanoate deaminase